MNKLIELLNKRNWEYTLKDGTLYFIFENSEEAVGENEQEKIESLTQMLSEY